MPIVLQNSFRSMDTNFPSSRCAVRIIMWGTTSFRDLLTDEFAGGPEATSMDGCRLFCLFAKNWSHGILGLMLKHIAEFFALEKDIRGRSAPSA